MFVVVNMPVSVFSLCVCVCVCPLVPVMGQEVFCHQADRSQRDE